MSCFVVLHLVFEDICDVVLTDDRGEINRSPLSVKSSMQKVASFRKKDTAYNKNKQSRMTLY